MFFLDDLRRPFRSRRSLDHRRTRCRRCEEVLQPPIVSIHADEVLRFRFGTDTSATRWTPLARDGADLPVALRTPAPALTSMGPGETADFTYVPTQPGEMSLEVWIPSGMRIVLPVTVRARHVAAKR